MSSLETLRVPADGDCLFHSLVHILKAIDPDTAHTARSLRELVALRALAPENEHVLATWVRLFRDTMDEARTDPVRAGALAIEWRHVEHAHPDLSTTDRVLIAAAMLDPTTYWGDQFALHVLEDELHLRIIVLDMTLKPMFRDAMPRRTEPRHVAFVQLQGIHYEPLVHEGRVMAWPVDAVPPDVMATYGGATS